MLENKDTISSAHLATGRAIDQLRRQLGIVLQDDTGTKLGACPVEGLTPELLEQLHALPAKRMYLLLTGARSNALGFNTTSNHPVRIDAQNLSLETLHALADPVITGVSLPEMDFEAGNAKENRLLHMAKYASLLPALLSVESAHFPKDWLHILSTDVETYYASPSLDMVQLAQIVLPVKGAENAKLLCFRLRYGTSVHLALLFGDRKAGSVPLTRIHSSCITGDILGSLRCDCGDQLQMALEQLKAATDGILLYLHQEGRGIGIANKIRAYQLQEQGYDTYDANLALGFEADERDFTIAGTILKQLGVSHIKLLTNNPSKMTAIEKTGIIVTERVPLIIEAGQHNHAYLDAKALKSGHLF